MAQCVVFSLIQLFSKVKLQNLNAIKIIGGIRATSVKDFTNARTQPQEHQNMLKNALNLLHYNILLNLN